MSLLALQRTEAVGGMTIGTATVAHAID